MAKKDKKLSFSNAEEAKAAKVTAKEEYDTAKGELKAFMKENKLSKDEDHSEHEKHGKKYSKLKATADAAKKKVEAIDAWLSDEKPGKEGKKGGAPREVKYEYPEGMTDAEKKKFRAKARAAANKPAKEEKAEGESKKKKKSAQPAPEAEVADKKGKSEGGEKKKKKKETKSED